MKHFVFLFLLVAFPGFSAVDIVQIEKDLTGSGLEGEVHGASHPNGLYVLTIRDPKDFFSHQEFPLTSQSKSVMQQLAGLQRHDRVKVRGTFIQNQAPIRHIDVVDLTVVKKFEDGMAGKGYSYNAQVPEELEGKSELIGKVHAKAAEGKILVIEYKDVVVPVFLKDPKWTKDLFRNDKIRLQYKIRKSPAEPTHVMLNELAAKPLEVLDVLQNWHGKKGSVEGQLILFPKSPQVAFNVFALQVPDESGFNREFTLVNFDDADQFKAIREKLQALWDTNLSGVEDARNKYVNRKVRVRATGTFNVVDAGQANPQVILSGPEALTVLP